MSNFADSRTEVPRYRSSQSYFMRSFLFCLSVFSSRLQLAGLGKKREETVKPTCFSLLYVESDFSPQYSSPVEALNLIVDSKSQPFELDNLTIELHAPSRQKKSLQSYWSVDFDFLFDVTLRDISFGKLKIKHLIFTFTGSVLLSQCIQQPTAACWSWEEKRGNCEANRL